MTSRYTPMIEQYLEIKRQHTDAILFFRLGDFYEMFFEDAELASKELDITLTARDGGTSQRVPMCGVPFHAVDNYLNKLIAKGYKVAICEQVEDPKACKGIVKREVIKIVTPGTIMSETFLQDTGNHYLALLYENNECINLAFSDITTGECSWISFNGESRHSSVCDQLYRILPVELILTGNIESFELIKMFLKNRIPNCTLTSLTVNDHSLLESLPSKHFPESQLPYTKSAVTAVGLLLYYLHQNLKTDLTHLNSLVEYKPFEHLMLDSSTLRNLEITRNMRDGSKKDTLFSVLDFTKTAMGTRKLKSWLEYPLINTIKIIDRQDAIEELVKTTTVRKELQLYLKEVYDLERILTRIDIGTANAKDLIALKNSLSVIPALKNALQAPSSKLLAKINSKLQNHDSVVQIINDAIIDDPPFSIRDGGMIKPGFDMELDDLRNFSKDSKAWVQNLEIEQRQQTGIKNLKIGYNKVFGYYIEVTKANIANVPLHFIRKQTLANAERYITPELKEFETKILGAQEKIVNIEYHLFTKVKDYIKSNLMGVQETARQIANLDAILSLSESAARYNYVRPTLGIKGEIHIKDGRHPVVERLLVREMFVPNDTELNKSDHEMIIITGPNMAGKSTYMRQVALLSLMTQVGSFIPAREACISPVDHIFTRVGASDDLATGQSTFMVEMNEVSYILKHATANSLIILDEIGRGTSTFDGMSIARAVVEYILQKVKAKTLFATHYHELTDLEEKYKGVANTSVAVKEKGNDIIFLRRIVSGGADKSYGVHVAKLAGLPNKVIDRAQELLVNLEQNHTSVAAVEQAATLSSSVQNQTISLFNSTITEELLKLDIMTMTPIEALNTLFRLQQSAKQEAGIS